MKASPWVAPIVAATFVVACTSSPTNSGGTSQGADSPRSAALNYAKALVRNDIHAANAVVARDRQYCPTTHSTGYQLAVPIPNRGEQLQTRVVAARHTWRVTFFTSNGDSSSSTRPALVVVREAGRYIVC